ncbi:hypothetical protein YPPY66_3663, partial [Yersinia pestis PY-66]
MAWEG